MLGLFFCYDVSMSDLYPRIYDIVRQIPAGQVKSYGQVAQAAGLFRGARVVGWALGVLPEGTDVPWQRVVNKQGRLSIVNPRYSPQTQKELLEGEGVSITERDSSYWVAVPEL